MADAKHMPPQIRNGWHTVMTGGRRLRNYRVYFSGGEARIVQARVFRQGAEPYWRDTWHANHRPMTIAAACAVRAAIDKATACGVSHG